jgi:hypothetical protein
MQKVRSSNLKQDMRTPGDGPRGGYSYHPTGSAAISYPAARYSLPIETGMLLAIVLSFVHSLYIVVRPYCVELARVPGSTV